MCMHCTLALGTVQQLLLSKTKTQNTNGALLADMYTLSRPSMNTSIFCSLTPGGNEGHDPPAESSRASRDVCYKRSFHRLFHGKLAHRRKSSYPLSRLDYVRVRASDVSYFLLACDTTECLDAGSYTTPTLS